MNAYQRLIRMRAEKVHEKRIAALAEKAARLAVAAKARAERRPAPKIDARTLDADSLRAEMERRGMATSDYTYVMHHRAPVLDPAVSAAIARDQAEAAAARAAEAKAIEAGSIDARHAPVEEVTERLRTLGLDAEVISAGLRPVELRPGPVDERKPRQGSEDVVSRSVTLGEPNEGTPLRKLSTNLG